MRRRSGRTWVVRTLLHPPQLILELLIAELELLDGSGELPHLRFKPLKTHDKIGLANLRRPLQSLLRHRALARYAFAAAEEQVQQSRRFAVLSPRGGETDASSKRRHESERGCPSRDEASHELHGAVESC